LHGRFVFWAKRRLIQQRYQDSGFRFKDGKHALRRHFRPPRNRVNGHPSVALT
jgi:hypothetical protein